MWLNRSPFRQPFTETADQVFASGQAPPAILVYVDAWTSYGGSQFVDSPGTGKYHSYLCEEVVPWVDARYRTLADREHRAIMGKSSGGFGSMITPMLRPDLFGSLATHAGDSLYELCYMRSSARRSGRCAATMPTSGPGGPTSGRGSRLRIRPTATLIGLLGVAAAFSANDDGTVDLPFDPRTGVLRPEVWQRWLDSRSGSDGTAVRRRASLAAVDLDRRRHQGRLLPRRRRRGIPGRAAGPPGSPMMSSDMSSLMLPMPRSTTGTRCRWRGCASECLQPPAADSVAAEAPVRLLTRSGERSSACLRGEGDGSSQATWNGDVWQCATDGGRRPSWQGEQSCWRRVVVRPPRRRARQPRQQAGSARRHRSRAAPTPRRRRQRSLPIALARAPCWPLLRARRSTGSRSTRPQSRTARAPARRTGRRYSASQPRRQA